MVSNEMIDTSYFSDGNRKELLRLLEKIPGRKNLVLERALIGPVELFVNVPTLQEHGVDRIFLLENGNIDHSQRNIVFLVRAEKARQAIAIVSQIKRLQSDGGEHDFWVLWVPRRTRFSEQILEERGVLGDVVSMEFPLLLQPLENDLMSMELEDSFGDLYLRKDPSCILASAKALMLIQNRYGLFPRILGKGDNAQRLAQLLVRLRSEAVAKGSSDKSNTLTPQLTPSTSIDNLIIIERSVDFSSALLTQLTYEGLIDEVYGIHHSQVELNSALVGSDQQSSKKSDTSNPPTAQPAKRKIKLDSSDKLYAQLRDANFSIVGSLLNKVARRLQNDYEGRHTSKTTAELKDFVGKLPGLQAEEQSLNVHIRLAGDVINKTRNETFRSMLEVQQNLIAGTDSSSLHDIVEELIARDFPLPAVLRLLCLESCVSGGLKAKDYDMVRRLVVQAYGYEHLLTLDALEKMQLLQPRGSRGTFAIPGTTASTGIGSSSTNPTTPATNYSSVRSSLRLIVEDVSEQTPDDIAYVFSGYAPLSVRLVQSILQKQTLSTITSTTLPNADTLHGWRGFEDTLRNVGGKTTDEHQRGTDKAAKARQTLTLTSRGSERKTSIIFFLGGVSFAEIAALRFVARQEEQKRRILICTTSIISGNKMMQAAIDSAGATGGASD